MKLRHFISQWQGLILASAFSVALLELRMLRSGNSHYSFLLWNLFLGYIPLCISYFLVQDAKRSSLKMAIGGLLWLLFFPNAPYIITDLMHLSHYKDVPWIDGLLLFSFAMTSLVAGLISLLHMRSLLQPALPPLIYRFLTIGVFLLSGFGVYLGRFERWNSWDILTHPFALLYNSFHNLTNPKALAVSVAFAACLLAMLQLFQQISKTFYDTDSKMPS